MPSSASQSLVKHQHLHTIPTRRSSDLMFRENRSTTAVPESLPSPGPSKRRQRRSSEGSAAGAGSCDASLRVQLPQRGRDWSLPVSLGRSEEHTSELQSPYDSVCRLLPHNHSSSTNIYTLSLHDALPI